MELTYMFLELFTCPEMAFAELSLSEWECVTISTYFSFFEMFSDGSSRPCLGYRDLVCIGSCLHMGTICTCLVVIILCGRMRVCAPQVPVNLLAP